VPTIELDDLELVEATRGALCLRARALQDAEKQMNPGLREMFQSTAKFHEAMAEKFKDARKQFSDRKGSAPKR
jgi:hypothetical protein